MKPVGNGTQAIITLTAYDDAGYTIETNTIILDSYKKFVSTAEDIFPGQDISDATYISYSSDRDIVAFQLNGTYDGMMLDGLEGM